jgi:signal transduction histidine kinase
MAHAYNNYATHLFSLERHKEALEYAKKGVRLREKTKDDYGLMYSYANISQLYSVLDSVKTALSYQMKSVQKAEQRGSDKLRAQSYVGLSLIYYKMNETRLAFEYEWKAVQLLEKSGNTEMLAHRYIALAMQYSGTGDSVSAVKYYKLSAEMAKQYNYRETERDAYFHTAIFFKDRKDYYQAYEYLKKYYKARDELLDKEKEGTIAELETKYQTEKKEEQIKRMSDEKLIQDLRLEKQGIVRNILIAGTLLLAGLGYILFSRYQIKKKLEQKTVMLKERSRISAELHDEVGSTLSTINILSHSAKMKLGTDMEKSAGLLEKINSNSQRMMDAMSDIVWSINPENDELGRIYVRMKEYASETLENKDIDYSFKISDELLALKLSPELRKDMYLVFKEAVNNVAKYSKAGHASITLARTNGSLRMQIKDNGQGFDTAVPRSGNGVANMRRRAEGHGGALEVMSSAGEGTEINVLLPIA